MDSLKQKLFLKFFVHCTVLFVYNFSFLMTNLINTLSLTATMWLQWMRISKWFPLSFFYEFFLQLFLHFQSCFQNLFVLLSSLLQLLGSLGHSWSKNLMMNISQEPLHWELSGQRFFLNRIDKIVIKRSFARSNKLDLFTKSFSLLFKSYDFSQALPTALSKALRIALSFFFYSSLLLLKCLFSSILNSLSFKQAITFLYYWIKYLENHNKRKQVISINIQIW